MARLTGENENVGLREVWAYLTVNEARGLADSLMTFFAEELADQGWHCHVGDEGGPTLTVCIESGGT